MEQVDVDDIEEHDGEVIVDAAEPINREHKSSFLPKSVLQLTKFNRAKVADTSSTTSTSAPQTPTDGDVTNPMDDSHATLGVEKEINSVVRSRSLENYYREQLDRNDHKKSFKARLFGSTTALPTISAPSFLRRRNVHDECDEGGGLKLNKRKQRMKGDVTADVEFMWQPSTTREPRSSMDSVHQAKTNEIQPIVAPLLMTTASDVSYDAVDGSPGVSEAQRNRQLVEHIQQKILKISEAIKLEQSTRDENVGDYLKLAGNADKQQVARIKSVFEKKNQKSNAAIAQLKKKFDTYHRRLREIESSGAVGRQSKSLRDVGANLRDFSGGVVDSVKGGLSGLQQATQNAAGAIASKPKDLASKLKNKFGSADNLSSLKYEEGGLEDTSLDYRYTSADDVSSTSSIDIGLSINHDEHVVHNSILSGPDSPHSGLRRVDPQYMQAIINQVAGVKSDLVSTQVAHQQFEVEWEDWKRLEQNTIDLLTRSLQEERFRCERLEVQLNDLTELHQREVTNLKQELFSMEEKVEYHASERARDMQEAIESCQTRLAKMELQQQQLVSVDGLENATARALLGKLINLLLSVMAVLLVLVSTVSGLLKPLTKSPVRVISTVVVIISIIIAYKTWDTIPMMSSMMSSR
uniref:transmembrane and coiled-coil domains protein 1-like isoform X1 n=1 Tax=Ciona intestinalis TaxID=7719 RepID=UPI000180BA83|nr:transmembrane and coiled-coil domains protein 1-like isoform X1 [Ciona intestinalis]|eukprot:XP_018673400.1 transmembrane and coiled-coil domains protein 1-like isoform X1 [Ciona intestinalis]